MNALLSIQNTFIKQALNSFLKSCLILLFCLTQTNYSLANNNNTILDDQVEYTISSHCITDFVALSIKDSGSSTAIEEICADPTLSLTIVFSNESNQTITLEFDDTYCTPWGTISLNISASLFTPGLWSVLSMNTANTTGIETCINPTGNCVFQIPDPNLETPIMLVDSPGCSENDLIATVTSNETFEVKLWFLNSEQICNTTASLSSCPTEMNFENLPAGTHEIVAWANTIDGICTAFDVLSKTVVIEDCTCDYYVDVQCALCDGDIFTLYDGLGNVATQGNGVSFTWTIFLEDGSHTSTTANPAYYPNALGGIINIHDSDCFDEECMPLEFGSSEECDDCELFKKKTFGITYQSWCNEDGSAGFAALYNGSLFNLECANLEWHINDQVSTDNPFTISDPSLQFTGTLIISSTGGPDGDEECQASINVEQKCFCLNIKPSGLGCGVHNVDDPYISWDDVQTEAFYAVEVFPGHSDCCEEASSMEPFGAITVEPFIYLEDLFGGQEPPECWGFRVRASCDIGGKSQFSEIYCFNDCLPEKNTEKTNSRNRNINSDLILVNPFDQAIEISNLNPEQEYDFELFGLAGEFILKTECKNTNTLQIPTTNIETGVYLISIKNRNTGDLSVEKIIKARK